MKIGDVITLLTDEGLLGVSRSRVYYAIAAGSVDRPRLNRSLCFVFSKANVAELRRYFHNPPKRGPKPKARI